MAGSVRPRYPSAAPEHRGEEAAFGAFGLGVAGAVEGSGPGKGREGPGGGVDGDGEHEDGEGRRESVGVDPIGQPGAHEPPTAETLVSTSTGAQSGATPTPVRTASAAALVNTMTTSEVPAAYSIGSANASSRAGTTRNPPPTPRKPVSNPTTVAVTSTFRARGHWQAKVGLNVMIGSSSAWRLT